MPLYFYVINIIIIRSIIKSNIPTSFVRIFTIRFTMNGTNCSFFWRFTFQIRTYRFVGKLKFMQPLRDQSIICCKIIFYAVSWHFFFIHTFTVITFLRQWMNHFNYVIISDVLNFISYMSKTYLCLNVSENSTQKIWNIVILILFVTVSLYCYFRNINADIVIFWSQLRLAVGKSLTTATYCKLAYFDELTFQW